MHSCNCQKLNGHNKRQIDEIGSLIQLVGENSRFRILCALEQDSHCVCDLEGHTLLSQSLISHHLRDLRTNNLVSSRKKGQKVYYSLTPYGSNVVKSLFSIKNLN